MPEFPPNDYRGSCEVQLRVNMVSAIQDMYGYTSDAAKRLRMDLMQFIEDHNENRFDEGLELFIMSFITLGEQMSVRGFINGLRDTYDGCVESLTHLTGLLVRQDLTSPSNLFTSATELLTGTSDNKKFSRLADIELFRHPDGLFRFRLEYEDIGVTVEWQQGVNPITTGQNFPDLDFQIISLVGTNGLDFSGLHLTQTFSGFTYLDGTTGDNFWWAVAAFDIWPGGSGNGLPAARDGTRSSAVYSLSGI